MRNAILIVCVAAVAAALAVPAQATVVRKAPFTTLFFDNYEGPDGVNPAQDGVDNGGLIGEWVAGTPNALNGTLVREQNWNSETPEFAVEGTQVGAMFGNGFGGPSADFGAWADFTDQTSGTIVFDTQIYLWPTVNNDRTYVVFELEDGSHANRAYAVIIAKLGDETMRIHDDFSGGNSLDQLTPVVGEWQRLIIEYELGSTDLTVTLGNQSQTINGIGSGGISQATHMDIREAQQFFYLDAPEPGTLSLLALGGLMMLRRSRRV